MRWRRHRDARPELDDAALAATWQVVSLLLDYPDEVLLARVPLLRGVVGELPADQRDPLLTFLRTLAEAMQQQPMGVTKVARKDRGGTFGEDLFLPPEQGRVVVDAGTLKTLHERVVGIAGQALYVPRSPEAGRLAVEAGLPRACLVEAGAWPVPPVSG